MRFKSSYWFRLVNKLVVGVIVVLLILVVVAYFVNWICAEQLVAFATCILAGGVVAAFWQIGQARKSTNAQLAFNLFSTLRRPQFKELLRDTIYALKPEGTKSLTDEQKVAIDELIDWFDMLGVLVAEGIVDEKIAIESFAGPPALRCWYKLAPYIRQEDCKRGFYADNYEDFTRRSLEHFANNKVRVMFRRKGEEKDKKNLVAELQRYKTTKTEERKLYPRSLKEIRKQRKSRWQEEIKRARKQNREKGEV